MENYKRVNKPTARKMYNRGFTIEIIPCKVLFTKDEFAWIKPFVTNIKDSTESENKFDRMVNAFEYYNCNAETGYFAHYYVLEEDYIKFKEGLTNGTRNTFQESSISDEISGRQNVCSNEA